MKSRFELYKELVTLDIQEHIETYKHFKKSKDGEKIISWSKRMIREIIKLNEQDDEAEQRLNEIAKKEDSAYQLFFSHNSAIALSNVKGDSRAALIDTESKLALVELDTNGVWLLGERRYEIMSILDSEGLQEYVAEHREAKKDELNGLIRWYKLVLDRADKKEISFHFEDLITSIDAKKIQPLLDSYKGKKPKYLAVLCYALGMDIEKLEQQVLTDATNARFGVTMTRQNFKHHLDKCKYGGIKGRDILIKSVKKQIQELTQ